jgi:hypothetical protein
LDLASNDLNSVIELYVEYQVWQLVLAVETSPTFLGGLSLDELEDHGERGLV